MVEFAEFYRNGGIFMHLITLTFIWISVLMFIQFINSITKKGLSFLPIINAGMWLILLLGILGSLFGSIDVLDAISHCAPEQKSAMMASGISFVLISCTALTHCSIKMRGNQAH